MSRGPTVPTNTELGQALTSLRISDKEADMAHVTTSWNDIGLLPPRAVEAGS